MSTIARHLPLLSTPTTLAAPEVAEAPSAVAPNVDDAEIGDQMLWRLVLSGVAVPAVSAAVELGTFIALAEGPLGISDLAQRTRSHERGIGILVEFLTAAGMLLPAPDGKVELSATARKFLLPDSRFYYNPFLERVAAVPLTAQDLVRAARRNASAVYGSKDIWREHEGSAARARGFATAAHARSLYTATRLTEASLTAGCRTLLDVCGGMGTQSAELAVANPGLQITLLDLPPVCQLAEAYLASRGVAEQVRAVPADVFREPWPDQQDAVLMSDVYHDWSWDECRQLSRRAFASLVPGGRLLLSEVLLDDPEDAELAAAYGVVMLFATRGRQYRLAELQTLLGEAGFQEVQRAERCGVHTVISARKPTL